MAQQVHVTIVDDLDGSVASESVRFGLDGLQYEIDLSAENAARLRALVARYVSVARHGAREERRAAPSDAGRSARLVRNQAETRNLRALAARNRNVPEAGGPKPGESRTATDTPATAGISGKRGPIVADPFRISPTTH